MCTFIITKLTHSCKRLLNSDLLTYNRLQCFATHFRYKDHNVKRTKPKNIYHSIDVPSVAQLVLKHISDDLANDKSAIFVSCAGSGVMAKLLLENNAQMVYAFEKNKEPFKRLEKLKKKYSNRVQIFNEEITNLPDMLQCHWKLDEELIDKWFEDIPSRNWCDDEPSIKLIAALSPNMSVKFLRFLIRELVRFELFFSKGRSQFLLLVSGKEVIHLSSKPDHQPKPKDYRPVSILYNCLFDVELIETVPYCGLEKTQYTPSEMTLVRITPKKCIENYKSEMLIDFRYFVQQMLMKRKRWIIPYLEIWFPNCGPNLIAMGIPLFKHLGDLTPDEVFQLFCHFYNSPDYETSVFKSATSNLHLTDEENETEVHEEEEVEKEHCIEEVVEVEKEQS